VARRRRIVLYSQSLSGAGHFVQTYEIARALASAHDVYLVDGGRPIPRAPARHPMSRLPLPRLYRAQGALAPVDRDQSLAAIMEERRRALRAGVERICPDVLLIEHFPFSKWELEDEIVRLIGDARVARPEVKVVCSLRDIPPGSVDRPLSAEYQDYVRRTLEQHFDLLLVHSDPRFIRLEDHIPWAPAIPIPLVYSGYVSEKLEGQGTETREPGAGNGHVIVSTGGASRLALLGDTIEAWRQLERRGAIGGRRLIVFLPPFARPDELDGLARAGNGHAARNGSIRLEPFTADFLPWMAGADLSISQAGYNTCANVLETRARSILVPNPSMYDQPPRARRLAERGLTRALDAARLDADGLAAAILAALSGPPPVHDLDLDGARRTREALEQLVDGCGSSADDKTPTPAADRGDGDTT
jgi:predicted glycosyltransferase